MSTARGGPGGSRSRDAAVAARHNQPIGARLDGPVKLLDLEAFDLGAGRLQARSAQLRIT